MAGVKNHKTNSKEEVATPTVASKKSNLFNGLRKTIQKKYDDAILDLTEPHLWLPSGNFVLNHILSGRFTRGYPAGRITQIFGDSGSGKSFLTANAIKQAQIENYMCVVLDSEMAVSRDYLEKVGVTFDEDKMMTIQVSTVEQTQDMMIEVLTGVKSEQEALGNKSDIKLLLIVDSLGFLASNKAAENAEKGHHAADMGTKAKALTTMITNVIQKIGITDTIAIMINHGAMEVGAMFPQMKPKGGQVMEFSPSISLRVTKSKIRAEQLAELTYLYDELGGIPDNLDTLGIVTKIDLYKSRFTRPFRKVQLMIPYDFGLPEYAGLFDYLKDNGVLSDGGRKGYYNFPEDRFPSDFTRKDFIKGGWADKIMARIITNENSGKLYNFVMKDAEDLAREQNVSPEEPIVDDDETVLVEENHSVNSSKKGK